MGARELALVLSFSVIGGCWQLGDDGVNREDYRNITSAVNIWELHPSVINMSLFDNSTIMKCDEPRVRELGENVMKCKAIQKGIFPSNLGLCNVCGENVTIQCWRNQVGLRTWYPTSITASDIKTCAVPYPPFVVRCPPPKYSSFYCGNKTESPGYEGDTLDCQCRINCRRVKVECKSLGVWNTTNVNMSNFCQDQTVIKVQSQLTVTYTNKEYSYSCASGYKLVGAPTRVCTAGVLEGQEPSCEQEADEATTPDKSGGLQIHHHTTNHTMSPSKDSKNTSIKIPLISLDVVLAIILIALLMYTWYQLRQQPPVSTSKSCLVHNPAFQMAAPPNEDEEPDYDYPEFNFQPRNPEVPPNRPEEVPMYDYPELNVRPQNQVPLNRPEEVPMYDYPELNVRPQNQVPLNQPEEVPMYDYPEFHVRPDNEDEECNYPVLKPRPVNNILIPPKQNVQQDNQECVINDMYMPANI